jgi:hypothetical protein
MCGLSIGCGRGGPFEYEKVSGKVVYADGSRIPAGGMELRFEALDAPQVEHASPRPAKASVNAEGVFDCVTSYKYGDGLIPGRHKVAIDVGPGPDGKPLVPKECTSIATTPLQINTKDAPLQIKVPRPGTISCTPYCRRLHFARLRAGVPPTAPPDGPERGVLASARSSSTSK